MQHIIDDIYIDADEYQFYFIQKSVIETGKTKGSVRYSSLTHHATPEQVHKQIESLSAQEYVNGDWKRMMSYFKKARANFIKALPELIQKREGKI